MRASDDKMTVERKTLLIAKMTTFAIAAPLAQAVENGYYQQELVSSADGGTGMAIPEPTTLTLTALGLFALVTRGRRRRAR